MPGRAKGGLKHGGGIKRKRHLEKEKRKRKRKKKGTEEKGTWQAERGKD